MARYTLHQTSSGLSLSPPSVGLPPIQTCVLTLRGVFKKRLAAEYCVVTVSVYSPSAKSAGRSSVSEEGLLIVIRSSVNFVTAFAALVSVTPTDSSSPTTFSMAPRTKKLRPAVALPSFKPVFLSSVSRIYMIFDFSPRISTAVWAIASRNALSCVKET